MFLHAYVGDKTSETARVSARLSRRQNKRDSEGFARLSRRQNKRDSGDGFARLSSETALISARFSRRRNKRK